MVTSVFEHARDDAFVRCGFSFSCNVTILKHRNVRAFQENWRQKIVFNVDLLCLYFFFLEKEFFRMMLPQVNRIYNFFKVFVRDRDVLPKVSLARF